MSTLESGSRLGPYEVVGRIGAGGMGEVWRAKDPRLGRDVAIKTLPDLFAADPERLARFHREAQLLASLNHPNIASIYGLEEAGGVRALILELVEGETLAQRILRGPIPIDEAVQLAKQIAAGLEAAHEQGIVHRDLKPANICITKAGTVKVLDFGLAKLTEASPAGAGRHDLSLSPTLTSPVLATNAGMLLGTAAYMSPEQARGRDADRRADMWAFGCVLYEMLTGKQPFAGETVTDVIAAVVTRDVDTSLLPPQTPAGVRWVIGRCLQKDPRERLRDAADAAALLDAPSATVAPAAPPRRGSRTPWVIAAVSAIVAVAALAAWAIFGRTQTPPAADPMAFQIAVTGARPDQVIALSSDARRLVYTALNNGQLAFWVRSLNDLTPRAVSGAGGVNGYSWPFWSPDGRYVAFASDGKLKKIDPSGGVAEILADLDSQFGGGTWSSTGTILFAGNDHGLRSVPAAGGVVTEVTTREPHELFHDCPWFLPDGRHFIYLAYSETRPDTRAVYLSELGSKSRTKLFASNTCAIYGSGYIVAPRETTLFAWRFDPATLTISGDPIQLASNVATFAGGEVGSFTMSATGVLIYRQGISEASNRRLVWFDRNGKQSEPVGPPLRASTIQLSPDGSRVAYAEGAADATDDVWVYNLTSGVKTRLTTDPAADHGVVWSSDGHKLFFDSHRDGLPGVYERVADGAAREQRVLPVEKGVGHAPRAVSPDGRYLLFAKSTTSSPPWHLWLQPLSPNGSATEYAPTPFDQAGAVISPDSRWVAYSTNESGKYEVFVQPLINPAAGKWQISTNGGNAPRWGRGGRELYYLADNGNLIAVTVSAGATFSAGPATTLFKTPFGVGTAGPPYDTRDGERFLVSLPTSDPDAQPMTALVNWPALVKASAGR